MKLRTIRETLSELKTQDPNTPISECYLRRLIKQEVIPHYNSGRRLFVNLDDVYKYFNSGDING